VYDWHPSILAKANASSEHLSRLLNEHINSVSETKNSLKDWINKNLVIKRLGIEKALDSELEALVAYPGSATTLFAGMVSRRARIGWSTHGHSAVDVNVYSSGGPGTDKIRGNVENIEVGKFLRDYLDVNVDEITTELQEKMDLTPPTEAEAQLFADRAAQLDGHPSDWMAQQSWDSFSASVGL
jgi:alkaline phosphatase